MDAAESKLRDLQLSLERLHGDQMEAFEAYKDGNTDKETFLQQKALYDQLETKLNDEETGEPFTAHTTNQVPFILVNADPSYKLREGGCLADIAPTLIEMMGMEQPKEMTGKSLIVK